MKYTRLLLVLLVGASLAISAATANTDVTKTVVSGKVWDTSYDDGFCVATVDVPDGNGYLNTILVHLTDEAQTAHGIYPEPEKIPCHFSTEREHIIASGWYVVVARGVEMPQGVIPYSVLRNALWDDRLIDYNANPIHIRYFRAEMYEIQSAGEDIPRMSPREMDNVRSRMSGLISDWYIKMDEKRFWGYAAKGSPMRDMQDAFSGAFSKNEKPDPSTLSTWFQVAEDDDTDDEVKHLKTLCQNDSFRDGFCILAPPAS